MNKTIKKALACLLAVLMVSTCLPFTAFASGTTRQWWVEDGVEIEDITAEPEYEGYNVNGYDDSDNHVDFDEHGDMRDAFKPVLFVTVSSQATYNKYYPQIAYNNSQTVIMNPGQLKAGDKIAVTLEMAGVDACRYIMFLGSFDTSLLKVAKWKNSSTWEAQSTATGGILKSGPNFADGLANSPRTLDPETGKININISSSFIFDGEKWSTYCGAGNRKGNTKFGLGVCTLSFEVLQNCDLKDALTIKADDPSLGANGAGFQFGAYDADIDSLNADDGRYFISTNLNGGDGCFAAAPTVYVNYSAGSAASHEHTYGTPSYDWNGTSCTATKTCTAADCDNSDDKTVTETAVGAVTADTATCCADGTKTYTATFTDTAFATQTKDVASPATGAHPGTEEVVDTPSTCLVKGTAHLKCTSTGGLQVGESYALALDSSNHDPSTIVTVPAQAATCTTNAVTAGTKCTNCNVVISGCEEQADTATDHGNFTYTPATAASVENPTAGTHVKACGNNGCDYSTEEPCTMVPTVTTEPTPSSTGIKHWECSLCHASYDEVLPKSDCPGHVFNYVSDGNATCTVDGTKSATCPLCGEFSRVTDEGSALGHKFTNYVSDGNATCLADGTKTATCDRDGCDAQDTIADEGSALGHKFTNYVSDGNATCTADGTKTATCDRDDCDAKDTVTDEGSALGHKFTNYVSDGNATCTADGTKTATCDRDDCDAKDTVADPDSALGHKFTTYVSDGNATCTADGTKTATCDRDDCDAKDTVADPDSALGHSFTNYVPNDDAKPATKLEDGMTASQTATCDRAGCDATDTKPGTVIPAEGFTVTVKAVDCGKVTLNGVDVTEGGVLEHVANGAKVTLTAEASTGAEFIGWIANDGTTASTATTFTPVVNADITYTPVFAEVKADDQIVVTFVDAYGNILDTKTIAAGSDITDLPTAPVRAGYTVADPAWSVTDFTALTEDTTVIAQYDKDPAKTFTVNAPGCDITIGTDVAQNSVSGIEYDTLVTVTNTSAKSWKIGDTTVAYGESYTFYVGADVDLTFDTIDVPKQPTVANVKTTISGGRVTVLATRSLEGFTYVNAGFIYGMGTVDEDTSLVDVNASTVYAVYCKTTSEQFSFSYTQKNNGQTITLKAFLTYVDKNNETQVICAPVVSEAR